MRHTDHTLRNYIIGFGLSLLLTLSAFISVTQNLYGGGLLIAVLATLAILQVLVQLYLFLHLSQDAKPRWRLVVLLFMLLVLGIVVGGSLWIMQSLHYNMHPHPSGEFIMKDEGITL